MITAIITGNNRGARYRSEYRLLRSIAYNLALLRERGVETELIFVEWNSLSSRPLMTVAVKKFFPEARCYVAGEDIHRCYSTNPHCRFMEYFARNAGMRRARGEVIIHAGAGVFFHPCLADFLAAGCLSPDTLYEAAAVVVPDEVVYGALDAGKLEEVARYAEGFHSRDEPFSGRPLRFMAGQRALFERVGGFDETIRFSRGGKDERFRRQVRLHGGKTRFAGWVYSPENRDGPHWSGGCAFDRDFLLPDFPPYAFLEDLPYENIRGWGLAACGERKIAPGVVELVAADEMKRRVISMERVYPEKSRWGRGIRTLNSCQYQLPMELTGETFDGAERRRMETLTFLGVVCADMSISLHYLVRRETREPWGFVLHAYPEDAANLPEERKEHGFINLDHDPLVPPAHWREGEVLVDRVDLSGLRPGRYRFHAGLWAYEALMPVEGEGSDLIDLGWWDVSPVMSFSMESRGAPITMRPFRRALFTAVLRGYDCKDDMLRLYFSPGRMRRGRQRVVTEFLPECASTDEPARSPVRFVHQLPRGRPGRLLVSESDLSMLPRGWWRVTVSDGNREGNGFMRKRSFLPGKFPVFKPMQRIIDREELPGTVKGSGGIVWKKVELDGYDNDGGLLRLYFHIVEPVERRYCVALRLSRVGRKGERKKDVGLCLDHFPRLPTVSWPAGSTVIDEIPLFACSPGRYLLQCGFLSDGEFMSAIDDGPGLAGVGEIEVP